VLIKYQFGQRWETCYGNRGKGQESRLHLQRVKTEGPCHTMASVWYRQKTALALRHPVPVDGCNMAMIKPITHHHVGRQVLLHLPSVRIVGAISVFAETFQPLNPIGCL
jgi:hypothetical protein